MTVRISLNEAMWEVQGFWPWTPQWNRALETGQGLQGITGWIPATVPGSVQVDLWRAGWIPDPVYRMQSMEAEWVEHRWWIYRTQVKVPHLDRGQTAWLVFQGLDDAAWVYAGTRCLGYHCGPFEPVSYDISELCDAKEPLEIRVAFKEPPDEMGQIGRTSETRTQKSRFGYKWDFGTRLVNLGIWDSAYVDVRNAVAIQDVLVTTDVVDSKGVVHVAVTAVSAEPKVVGSEIAVKISCRDSEEKVVVEASVPLDEETSQATIDLSVREPRIWFPNGYGEQPLYTVEVELWKDQDLQDRRQVRTGIRSLRYAKNDGHSEALPYTLVINGQRIYAKGVNITPLDHAYGAVTDEQYRWLVRSMRDAHINLVRVNGVGVIEKEIFYDLCDEYGILVWQEFIQTSSGIDNVPSTDPHFIELLERTAVAAVTQKRNHVSTTLWDGGNELTRQENRPVDYDNPVIARLKRVVDQLDPQRLFLPTSASGPVEFVSEEPGVGHDVHGEWQYLGNPKHYSFYSKNDALFHSEFGAAGMASVATLKKVLGPDSLEVTTMHADPVWRWHGEWWDTLSRDTDLFGEFSDISTFVDASQWVQAEALRFIIEANRRRKFVNSGSVVWQLNEPWPNISNTCLIDYYGRSKMAYHWVKNAFAPTLATLTYGQLDVSLDQQFSAPLTLIADATERPWTVYVTVINSHGDVVHRLDYRANRVSLDAAKDLGVVAFPVTEALRGLFMVRVEVMAGVGDRETADAVTNTNDYFFSTESDHPYGTAYHIAKAEIVAKPHQPWSWDEAQGMYFGAYRVENTGHDLALHVRAEELTDAYWVHCEPNYVTLVPEQSVIISVSAEPKRTGGFLRSEWSERDDVPLPDMRFRAFCQVLDLSGK